jgi:hypothetical protein
MKRVKRPAATPVPGIRLHGTLATNLEAAAISAARLRYARVYPDTLRFWRDLVDLARQSLPADSLGRAHPLAQIADHLERELNDRAEDRGA